MKGKIKQVAGKAVGDRDLEAEGKAENVDGKIQEKLGRIKKLLNPPLGKPRGIFTVRMNVYFQIAR